MYNRFEVIIEVDGQVGCWGIYARDNGAAWVFWFVDFGKPYRKLVFW